MRMNQYLFISLSILAITCWDSSEGEDIHFGPGPDSDEVVVADGTKK
jgi:hypothetical protein